MKTLLRFQNFLITGLSNLSANSSIGVLVTVPPTIASEIFYPYSLLIFIKMFANYWTMVSSLHIIFEHDLRALCYCIASIIDIDNLECYVKFKPTNQSCSDSKFYQSINMQIISTLLVVYR